jgi:hypothetical protein
MRVAKSLIVLWVLLLSSLAFAQPLPPITGCGPGGDLCYYAQRFRPYLKFSKDVDNTTGSNAPVDEQIRPCSWDWLVRRSLLGWINFGILINTDQLSQDPTLILDATFSLANGGPTYVSDVRNCRPNYAACGDNSYVLLDTIDVNNFYNCGQPWADVQGGAGIYAHAEYVKENPDLVNIEYIILYPYNRGLNNGLCTILDEIVLKETGDHEGDLTFLTLVYSKACDQIIRATFSAHGQILLAYDLTYIQPPVQYSPLSITNDITGRYTGIVPAMNVVVNKWYLDPGQGGIPNGVKNCCWEGICIACGVKYRNFYEPCDDGNNYVSFVQDPDTGVYEHIVAYIEWGSHEMYPSFCGDAFCCPKHGGDGTSFLPTQVTYLGTLANMLQPGEWASANAPFIFYNGKWGNDPQPPIMHNTWYYPDQPYLYACSGTTITNNPFCIPADRFVDKSPYQTALPWPPVTPPATATCNLALAPPKAICQNVWVTADSNCSAVASIDMGSTCPGSASCILSQIPKGPFQVGSHNVTLTATNDLGASNQCSATVIVIDKTPPSITAPPPLTLSTGPGATQCGVHVNELAFKTLVNDNCPGVRTSQSGVPHGWVFPVGSTTIINTATDSSGNTATATQTVTVIDNTPPTITMLTGASSFPANHKMIDFTVNYNATDNCDQPVCQISSVTSNESISSSDYTIVDAHHVKLRADCLGSVNPRIYTITVSCSDASGNTSNQAVPVSVHPIIVGDVNGDGKVDCADLAIIKASFGKKCGQTGFDPRADLNGDCVVDVRDLAIVSKQLPPGTRCP